MKIAFTGAKFLIKKLVEQIDQDYLIGKIVQKKPQKFIKRFYKFRNRKIVLF